MLVFEVLHRSKFELGQLVTLAFASAALFAATAARSEGLPEDVAAQIALPPSASSARSEERGSVRAEAAAVAAAAEPKKRTGPLEEEVLEAARAHSLPSDFFRRLIWQESRFRPNAISKAGAQGIAQFMPSTAAWRGLADPFDSSQALHESARWLHELWGQFGNLGLAAAAYNAGPGRVSRWLAGRSTLPAETRDYVKIVTGEPAERWSGCAGGEEGASAECPIVRSQTTSVLSPQTSPASKQVSIISKLEPPRAPILKGVTISDIDAGPWGPWGLQIAGDWSQTRALAQFKTIQTRFSGVLGNRRPVILRGQMAGKGSATWYRVRIAEATRERAVSLCAKLEKAGGSCLVLRN